MEKKAWRYYTAEGLGDLLPGTVLAKRALEARLRDYFSVHGFSEIETPGLEFYDVYTSGSLAAEENLFKLIDEKGRVLALRYDGTVPALRLASTKYREADMPLRFAYIQSMYRFREGGGERRRAFTQAGLELLGRADIAADAEMIALAIGACQAIGISEPQLTLGHPAFTRALFDAWSLSEEAQTELFSRIDEKNSLGVEALARELALPELAQSLLQDFFDQALSDGEWRKLRTLPLPDRAKAEAERLCAVIDLLTEWGFGEYLAVDLGMLNSMNYYTGLVFKGFTHGLGYPLLSGGRYDQAAASFEREIPATGFSMGVEQALTALERQGKAVTEAAPLCLIGAAPECLGALWALAEAERRGNERVKLCPEVSSASALRKTAVAERAARWVYLEASGETRREELG